MCQDLTFPPGVDGGGQVVAQACASVASESIWR